MVVFFLFQCIMELNISFSFETKVYNSMFLEEDFYIRKMFATMLHFANVPTRVIADLMGHSEIGTTENSYILSFANSYTRMYEYMKDALRYKAT